MISPRSRVFSLFNRRTIGVHAAVKKVSLPDKSGKETTYWRFEFRRTFMAKAIGRYTFGPGTSEGRVCHGGE